jgi:hypothetical protein
MSLRSFVDACAVAFVLTLLCLTPSTAQGVELLSENFNSVATLPGAGWVQTNNSNPLGESNWFQGNSGIFPAQAGAADAYIGANFVNAGAGGNVSNWLILPELALDPTIALTFYTRTEELSFFPDRLEVRLSTSGGSSNVGATDTSVGDFSTLLLAINPTLDIGGYPEAWTKFTVDLSGVLGGPISGRLAFRYFVTNTDENGNYIGIDTVRVGTVPEPGTAGLLALGMAGCFFVRRRSRR